MIVAILIILGLVAAISFFAWQIQIERADMLAAQVQIAHIQVQGRIDTIDHLWPYAVLISVVLIALAAVIAYVVIYVKRGTTVINDNRTVYLIAPGGQSRREYYKTLANDVTVYRLPAGVKQLEKRQ